MAGDGTTYSIDIATNAAGVEPAAASCARLAESLTGASSAAAQAAEAVKKGEASYKAAEAAANKAALALEKIGIAAQGASGPKLQGLLARQAEAAEKARAAAAAMNVEASALDKLKSAASKAEAAEKKLAKARGNGNLGKAASELAGLGGPLGAVASKTLGLADSFGDLKEALGSGKGAMAFAAVGAVALAAAIVAVGAAAVAGVGAVALWAVKLADKGGELKPLSAQLSKNFNKMFSGLKVKPVIGAFEKIVNLFDESTATSKAIKSVFNSMFQPLLDGITDFVPKMITAFIKFEILVLKGLIAIKPYGGVFQAIGLGLLIFVGVVALVVAAVVVAGVAMAAAFALLIALPFIIQANFKSMSDGISAAIGGAMDWVTGKVNGVIDFLKNLSLSSIGTNIIKGLADGLLLGGPQVLAAITGVVGGAIDGAKKLLKINSPSLVFAEIGESTGEGMVKGVDNTAGDVQGSMESMISPPIPAAGAAPSAKGSGGSTYQITINAAGGDGQSIAEALMRVLADLGAQAGTAVPSV